MKTLTRSLEKYLFAIYTLQKNSKKVTPLLVQGIIGHNKATVLNSIKLLAIKGYAEYFPHKGVTLTDKGKETASTIEKRRSITSIFLEKFLLLEGDSLKEALDEIEYYVTDSMLERFENFSDFLNFCPCARPKWLSNLKHYQQNGEMTENCAKCIEKGSAPKCKGCSFK